MKRRPTQSKYSRRARIAAIVEDLARRLRARANATLAAELGKVSPKLAATYRGRAG